MYAWNFFCFLCEMRRIFTILQKWFLTTLLYFSVFSFDIPIVWKSQIHRQRFGSGQWTDLFTNQKPKTRDFSGTRRRFHLDCGSKSAWAFEGRIEKKAFEKAKHAIVVSIETDPLGNQCFWKKYTLNSCLTFLSFAVKVY